MRDWVFIVALILAGAVAIGLVGEIGSELGLRDLEAQKLPAQVRLP